MYGVVSFWFNSQQEKKCIAYILSVLKGEILLDGEFPNIVAEYRVPFSFYQGEGHKNENFHEGKFQSADARHRDF